jgi:hypothetical protein
MVQHHGSSSGGGHYTGKFLINFKKFNKILFLILINFIFLAVGMAPNGSFYNFDDSRVYSLTAEQALKSSAYILFYELDKSTLKENGQSRVPNGHSVVHQNGHTYSKSTVEPTSSLTKPSMSYAAAASSSSSFSKPNLPKIIPHTVMKQQQKQQKENNEASPSKNGVKSLGANGISNGENQRVAPLTIKLNNGQKHENGNVQRPQPAVLAVVKCKPQNGQPTLPSMPMISDDEEDVKMDVKNSSIVTTPPSKSLVPYDDDDDDDTESMKEAKIFPTSAGPFLVIDSKESAKKGPSVAGSTIMTKALNGQSVKRNDDPIQQLNKLHHNGYGSSNVMSWSNEPSKMNHEVNKDQQKEDRKRPHEHEDDIEMDRGRVKKIKRSSSPQRSNGKLPNPFQEQQNKQNGNGHYDRPSNNHYSNQNGNYSRPNSFYQQNNGHNNYQKKNNYSQNNGYANKNRNHNNFNRNRSNNGYNNYPSIQYYRNR